VENRLNAVLKQDALFVQNEKQEKKILKSIKPEWIGNEKENANLGTASDVAHQTEKVNSIVPNAY
jgi:hypothetical protein